MTKDLNSNTPRPTFGLAPMANVTTYPFASQCIEYGADFVWTPMVHTDTILNNWAEAKKILDFKEIKGYYIQIIGNDPDKIASAITLIQKNLNPLGIDLNFACPDKNIVKSGCGGAMMRKPEDMYKIAMAAQRVSKRPISVKLRAGWDNYSDVEDIVRELEKLGVNRITVHPRTVKQGFGGKADWKIIKKLVAKYPKIDIIGSGDVMDYMDALEKQSDTGCAGVIIGRRAIGHPWVFQEIKEKKEYVPTPNERLRLILEVAEKSNDIWGDKGITEAKKHFAAYAKGYPGAPELRKKLMSCHTIEDVRMVAS